MTQAFSYQEAQQRGSVANLVTFCEQITTKGLLPEAEELRLRKLITDTCGAFQMLTVSERAVVQVGDHDPEVRSCL